jgi:hypothetical protein
VRAWFWAFAIINALILAIRIAVPKKQVTAWQGLESDNWAAGFGKVIAISLQLGTVLLLVYAARSIA